MKYSGYYKIVFIFLFGMSLMLTQSCIFGKKGGRAERQAEKVQKELDKETQAEFDKAYKHHMEQQSELTKKQMKEMKKRQKQINKPRKRSLWDRLFRKNCP